MTTETLRQWAERTAPTLDAEGWARAERIAAGETCGCPWSNGHGIQPGCTHCGGTGRISLRKTVALLAHRDKVAAELSTKMRARITGGPAFGFRTDEALERRRLFACQREAGGIVESERTDFGCEVARVLT